MRLVALAALAALLPCAGLAQTCTDRASMLRRLTEGLGYEAPLMAGLSLVRFQGDVEWTQTLVELWGTEGGNFTIIRHLPNGTSCEVFSGNAFQTFHAPIPGTLN